VEADESLCRGAGADFGVAGDVWWGFYFRRGGIFLEAAGEPYVDLLGWGFALGGVSVGAAVSGLSAVAKFECELSGFAKCK
jgi:hypothetical protein